MNWLLFALCSWVCFGAQLGLAKHLSAGSGEIYPSFVIPLLVYISLHAAPRSALWAALVLGCLADLADLSNTHAMTTGSTMQVLGPSALGYLVAAQLVISLRGMVLAQNFFTPIILNLLAAFVAGLVVVAVFTVRSFYPDPIAWQPAHQLMIVGGSALYTAIAAIPVSILLHLVSPWFGFTTPHSHHRVGHARAFKR